MRDIHAKDETIFYCDMLMAITEILESHRKYYEGTILRYEGQKENEK